jgi:multidrug resistance protein
MNADQSLDLAFPPATQTGLGLLRIESRMDAAEMGDRDHFRIQAIGGRVDSSLVMIAPQLVPQSREEAEFLRPIPDAEIPLWFRETSSSAKLPNGMRSYLETGLLWGVMPADNPEAGASREWAIRTTLWLTEPEMVSGKTVVELPRQGLQSLSWRWPTGTVLEVDAWQLQQVITAYMVPFAFASLIQGPLSDALGRRPVMIWGMALYTVGSVACMFAQNYEQLIASRVLQGATAGVGVVIGRAIIRDLYEGAAAQRLMNLTTMIFGLAPAVAPIIGGWVHVAFGWRAVFAVMVVCGVVFATASWWKLPETHPPQARITLNARNLAATSFTVMRHHEILMVALTAAINFCSLACFIGSAPAIIEKLWGMSVAS